MTSRLIVGRGKWDRYTLDGQRVPGVTTIVGAMDKGGLPNAAAREVALWAATHAGELGTLGADEWTTLAAGAHRRVWDIARDNGTRLHVIAQALIYGEPVPDEDADGLPWPDDVRRMGEQVARFMDAWDVQPILVETPVFHESHKWAGRPDLLADLRGGHRVLIDYKTSASGIWHETALQVAAYGEATHVSIDGNDRPMVKPERYAALWVRPDGWQLQPLAVKRDTYGTFRALQRVHAWKSQKREDVVGAALPIPEEGVA